MDPQNHNAKMMDQHNALPQVNQVHTVRKARFGWQAVVALTITAKDCGYTKEDFIEAVEMYEHFGNIELEDVPTPSPQD